jgi:hypothetical protein
MRPTRWLALACWLSASAAFAEEAAAPPPIYRWVDENGIVHYTTSLERVPEELRDQPLRREPASAQAPAGVDAWVARERVADPPKPAADAAAPVENSALAALNARIAELERAIAADEQMLKGDLIEAAAPASNDALKAVAERMPARIAELKKLQAERDALLAAPGAE